MRKNKRQQAEVEIHNMTFRMGYDNALLNNKSKEDLYNKLLQLPESFTFMGKTYTKEKEVDPWGGCACGSSSTCGTTFTVDKSGVIDRPNLIEGRYTVLIKKETNTL